MNARVRAAAAVVLDPGVHVLDRNLDAQLELLLLGRVHDRDRTIRRLRRLGVVAELVVQLRFDVFERDHLLAARLLRFPRAWNGPAFGATKKPGHLFERPLRG